VTDSHDYPSKNPGDPDASTSSVPTVTMKSYSLASALEIVSSDGCTSGAELREMRSAIAAVEKFARRAAAEIEANPIALRPVFAAVLPAAHGMKRKRVSNIKSAIAALLIKIGAHDPHEMIVFELSAAWAACRDLVSDVRERAKITPFLRYAEQQNVLPQDIDAGFVERYRDWRRSRTLLVDVDISINAIRRVWNKAVRAVPTWPGRHLAGRKNPVVFVLPIETFTAEFQADVSALLQFLSRPSPLLSGRRGLRAITVEEYRRFSYRAASILVLHGREPATINALADIVKPSAVEIILLDLYYRKGDRWSGHAVTMASNLTVIARDYVKAPAEDLAALAEMRQRVKLKNRGMSERNLDRIAQFDQPGRLKAFYNLPDRCLEAAEGMWKKSKARAAELHERALAMAILREKPFRRKNLAAIHLDRNLLRNPDGKLYRIKFTAEEAKTAKPIDVVISKDLSATLDRHIKKYRPMLPGADSPWLFPGTEGRHRAPCNLAKKVSALIQEHLGVQFNLHLYRHLCALTNYNADENAGPVVQALLDHADLRTTEGAYVAIRGRAAQRRYADILAALRGTSASARSRSTRGRPRGGKKESE